MESMEYMDFCGKVAEQFGLGELTAPPERVTGGFLHRMYRLETAAGKYALKALNPEIMKRPGTMENYRRAEEIERLLWEQGIPMIPALERDGGKMQCLEGQYYYLFDWSEGKALGWHEIEEKHCRTIGKLLARIHKVPCQKMHAEGSGGADAEAIERFRRADAEVEESAERADAEVEESAERADAEAERSSGSADAKAKEIAHGTAEACTEGTEDDETDAPEQKQNAATDWDALIKTARSGQPDVAEVLEGNRELLYLAEKEYAAALDGIPDVSCFCHGDMDCKNVLWLDGEPLLIDLECLDYGNPLLEMFQLALSWAGWAVCEMDFGRFGGFLEAYQAEYGEVRADWDRISGIGYGWLDWLAYNVRRALGIECGDEEERELGIHEVHESIRRIRHFHSARQKLVSYMAARGW